MAELLFAKILTQTALLGCSGALWALVGLALSAATMSKYIAYAAGWNKGNGGFFLLIKSPFSSSPTP